MTFEESVMFNALSETEKKELAEHFASKRLTAEEIKMTKSFGTSPVSTWAQKMMQM